MPHGHTGKKVTRDDQGSTGITQLPPPPTEPNSVSNGVIQSSVPSKTEQYVKLAVVRSAKNLFNDDWTVARVILPDVSTNKLTKSMPEVDRSE